MVARLFSGGEDPRGHRSRVGQVARLAPQLLQRHVVVLGACEKQHVGANPVRDFAGAHRGSRTKKVVGRGSPGDVHALLQSPL